MQTRALVCPPASLLRVDGADLPVGVGFSSRLKARLVDLGIREVLPRRMVFVLINALGLRGA